MFRILLSHTLKGMVRSVIWKRSLGASIFWTIIITILALNFLSIGLYFDRILRELFPGSSAIQLINSILLYYLFADLLLRRFLQRTPTLAVGSYLILPVRRSAVVHFIVSRSLVNLFNLFPLLILMPVVINDVIPAVSPLQALSWPMGIYMLILNNSLLHLYMDRQSILKPGRAILLVLFLVMFLTADKLDLFSLRSLSSGLFGYLSALPLTGIVPAVLLILTYRLNFKTFRRQMYLDSMADISGPATAFKGELNFLEKILGETGMYLQLELKLLFRNRRTRSTLVMGFGSLILAPLIYLSVNRDLQFYPHPHLADLYKNRIVKSSPSDHVVTFNIPKVDLPDGAWIYLTGNDPELSNWRPDGIPMQLQPDSSWKCSIAFPNETRIKYIYTLGSWATETAKGDSLKPDTQTLIVTQDTTVIYTDPRWKIPRRSLLADVMLIYMGMLFSGLLMLFYGQFMIAWESGYYEFLMTQNIDLIKYLNSKYLLLIIFGVLNNLILLALVFINPVIVYINLALFLYNTGINILVLFFLVTFTRKRLDLNASIFGTQGKGASHYSTILPVLIVPLLVYLLFGLNGMGDAGIWTLALLGILGIVFRKYAMNRITERLRRQKYLIVGGFRQS